MNARENVRLLIRKRFEACFGPNYTAVGQLADLARRFGAVDHLFEERKRAARATRRVARVGAGQSARLVLAFELLRVLELLIARRLRAARTALQLDQWLLRHGARDVPLFDGSRRRTGRWSRPQFVRLLFGQRRRARQRVRRDGTRARRHRLRAVMRRRRQLREFVGSRLVAERRTRVLLGLVLGGRRPDASDGLVLHAAVLARSVSARAGIVDGVELLRAGGVHGAVHRAIHLRLRGVLRPNTPRCSVVRRRDPLPRHWNARQLGQLGGSGSGVGRRSFRCGLLLS